MKHILAAVDGSDASFRALGHASQLARKLKTALTILIVRLVIVGRKGAVAALSAEEAQEIQEKSKSTALANGYGNAKIMVEKSRDTAFKIVDIAIEQNTDLIVMGASGKTGFKAFLLGSVSQEVLRKPPVL